MSDILEKIDAFASLGSTEEFVELVMERRPQRARHKKGSDARKARRKAKIYRRKNKAKLKKAARKRKRVQSRKAYKAKKARMEKKGMTVTGRRKRKYINKA